MSFRLRSRTKRRARHARAVLAVAQAVLLAGLAGCSLPSWSWKSPPQPCVLDPGLSKEELVAHLNRNLAGTGTEGGLVSWQAVKAELKVTGVPTLPAYIAVEAPRNLRLRVSHPVNGGQEVDIGSNAERFWIWEKGSRQTITARHEDVSLALQHMNMPIHIHPDWLMEVFGVVPLDASEFRMVRPSPESRDVELISSRTSPLGRPLERVIRVDICRGCITEHLLRHPGGGDIARAMLERYTTLPEGISLPLLVKMQWPEAQVEMTVRMGNVEVNPPSLAGNGSLWQLPKIAGSETIDVGAIARRAAATSGISSAVHQEGDDRGARERDDVQPGRASLPSSDELEAPEPVRRNPRPGSFLPEETGEPEWTKPVMTRKLTSEPEAEPEGRPQSAYSEGAWRSSSARRPPAPE